MLNFRDSRVVSRSVAGILVFFHLLTWVAVALHSSAERSSTTVTIEAEHNASWLFQHDENSCPICQYAGSARIPATRQAVALDARWIETATCTAFVYCTSFANHRFAAPRAPPIIV